MRQTLLKYFPVWKTLQERERDECIGSEFRSNRAPLLALTIVVAALVGAYIIFHADGVGQQDAKTLIDKRERVARNTII